MHPLQQLRQLLRDTSPQQGRVVSSQENTLVLATPQGSLSVSRSPNDATRYQPGDVVLLANGVVVGKRNREPTVYVV